MEKSWKKLERLVAAIHHALNKADATIQWGERINGREFDVTIRFSQFAYNYLTTVECKDYLVPVKEVEAFVTKARRAGANKVVMVSSVGFQSGAIEVGRDECVDLYELKEAEDWPPFIKVVQQIPAIGITDIELLDAARGVVHRFPNEASALQYFVRHTTFSFAAGGQQQTLDDVIAASRRAWEPRVNDEEQQFEVPLEPPCHAHVPFVDPLDVVAVRFTARRVTALGLDSGGIDPSMVPALFSFRNVITGEDLRISEADIWIGFDTEIEEGKFYYDPFHSQHYYCEKREGNKLQVALLESYQHGNLFQVRYTQTLTGHARVIEITDPSQLCRLQRMYERLCAKDATALKAKPKKVQRNDPCPCGSGAKFKRCHGK